MVHYHLRGETKPNERRTAVTPADAKALLDAGHKVTVERFAERCYHDSEYEKVGCEIVQAGLWEKEGKVHLEAVVLGLKELPEAKSALPHKHIMFAHCFKYQDDWKNVMQRFIDGSGALYDLEFLKDTTGRRKVAFGRSAGFNGMGVGILAWAHQKTNATKMTVNTFPKDVFYPKQEDFVSHCKQAIAAAGRAPKIIIIGALGRCGSGAADLAKQAGVPEENITRWDMQETSKGGPFKEILEHDIFVNCIYLDPTAKTPPFLTSEMLEEERQLSVMVDVSCDPNNPANPVPVYKACTTFSVPVNRVKSFGVPPEGTEVECTKDLGMEGFGKCAKKGDKGKITGTDVTMPSGAVFSYSPVSFSTSAKVSLPFDVIAIDHLPSLVPCEASNEFSAGLLPLLLDFEKDSETVWARALEVYHAKKEEVEKEQ
eukprot:TRINITY_DN2053_c0_g3_i1.p1 TRINITY_DN2053_c0_g3~~TRINITY_DN2053_c0_g3_i1.p1  ORF type:complete len:428 (+),score=138.45 TRINITY_DN2053_c0_g3_i1:51-1334(+)